LTAVSVSGSVTTLIASSSDNVVNVGETTNKVSSSISVTPVSVDSVDSKVVSIFISVGFVMNSGRVTSHGCVVNADVDSVSLIVTEGIVGTSSGKGSVVILKTVVEGRLNSSVVGKI